MEDFLIEASRQLEWGPSPNKVSWTEYCKQKIDADPEYAHKISDGSPDSLFMSDQILRLVVSANNVYEFGPEKKKNALNMLKSLRPEDAIHIPHVRFDYDTGKIIDWNRSMCDLTRISAAQVVGKSYADVLEEWCPNLSGEYKEAAVDWVKKREDQQSKHSKPEDVREDYLFPLPLPIKYNPSFKYASNTRRYDEYVELLAARADRLFNLYPGFTSYSGVPQCVRDREKKTRVWNFDTSGWVGGVEFTLRRKQYLPSLQSLCRELLPNGEHALNEDGSLVVTKAASKTSDRSSHTTNDDCSLIADYLRKCGPAGVRYIREVMHAVNKRCRNYQLRNKTFYFTTDWSSHTETSDIHKNVLDALGGAALILEKVEKEKVTWTLNFDAQVKGVEEEPFMRQWKPKALREFRAREVDEKWKAFKENIAPVLRENKYAIVTCGATDSNSVLPVVDRPELAVLTLKIDGYVRTEGSDRDEKFKAHATVQVPASLNFFQLHRVICLTMNNRSSARRETHEWRVPNHASKYERPFSHGNFEYVQLGETYFVENGRREDYGFATTELFDTGSAIRQRVSLTGAYVDQDMPLNFYGKHGSDGYSVSELGRNYGQIKACIHSTCISSVFFQPGAYAMMQDGLGNYSTTYKITCMKSEKYEGPLPLNPNINIMQPKCLRGKPEDGNDYWSVKRANAELHHDRGCLRRNLCKIGENDYMVQMPWCLLKANPKRLWGFTKNHIPAAADLTGLDDHPIFLNGEPPLPSSEDYDAYVSSLRGKIDPDFLPENVADEYGSFSVPFGGRPRSHRRFSLEAEVTENQSKIGDVWTREVDDEVKRIDSLQPTPKKGKATGKKRKALMHLN